MLPAARPFWIGLGLALTIGLSLGIATCARSTHAPGSYSPF
jgi:hypothetical protein